MYGLQAGSGELPAWPAAENSSCAVAAFFTLDAWLAAACPPATVPATIAPALGSVPQLDLAHNEPHHLDLALGYWVSLPPWYDH